MTHQDDHWLRRFTRRLNAYCQTLRGPGRSIPARIASALQGVCALGILGGVLLLLYAMVLIPFTPSIADLRKAKADQPSIVMSADGKQLTAFKRMNREWIELDQIAPHVVSALIATEDHRFYRHHGVDLKRIAAGIVHTLSGDPQGGSTLTQQLARNLYPEQIGRKRSITRKLKEIITAFKIEYAYSKQEILLTYLNTMPFLYNAFGIEMGARTYFDKPASRLNLLESATLIGMLKGTSYYNPVLNPQRAKQRRNVVLAQMVKRGVLPRRQFDTLRNRPLTLNFERQPEPLGPAPHFAAHLRKWLIDWADRNDYNIHADGLVIHTTIDARLQAAANLAVARQLDNLQAIADVEWGLQSEQLISSSPAAYVDLRRRVPPFGHFWNSKNNLVDAFIRETSAYRSAIDAGATPDTALAQLKADAAFIDKLRSEKTRLQAGFVAIDPTTAQIKAWVGSRDFATDQFDHVAQARRQPGSTFKPFVYGAALEQGMAPSRRFMDISVEIAMQDGTVWRPTDMSAPSGRAMTAREGLIHSKNSITVQVMQEVGPRKTVALARKMGITDSTLDAVPALALGTSPVTLLEMAVAYSTLAARGEYRPPQMVTRITDKNGKLLVSFTAENQRAMSAQSAEDLIDILRGAVSQGTGQALRARFGIKADVAGKTGTTQNNTDGWFMLMHPQLVAGAWVGFNDARVTMRSNYWGQGGHNALLPVGDFYRQALQRRLIDSDVRFPKPRGSLFDSILDRLDELFGKRRPQPAPPPDTPEPKDEPNTPIDEVERMLKQAREAEQIYERERRRVETAIENQAQAVDRVRKEIEKFGQRKDERKQEDLYSPEAEVTDRQQ